MNRMSFDDYANHIYQKHRLAVALAILKSKPTNIKTDEYLKELKSKIDDKMDDDEVTICSDDFLMDADDESNDSVTILKDFDPDFVNDDQNLGDDNSTSNRPTMPENLSQTTYYDDSQSQYNNDITVPPTANVMLSKNDQNFTQTIDIEESINKHVITNDFNDRIRNVDQNPDAGQISDVTYYDSQKTLLYTLHGFTQNYTHYSPSQPDLIIPNKYLYNVNKNNNSTVQNKDNNTVTTNIQDGTRIDNKINNFDNENQTNKEEFEYIQTMNLFSKNNDDNFDEIQNNSRLNNNERDETMTDINIIINKEAKNSATNFSQNIDKYFEYMGTSFEKGNNAKKADQDHKTTDNVEMNDVTFGYSQSIDYVSQNRELSQNNTKKVDQNPKPTDEIQFNDVSFGYSQSIDYVSQNRELSQNNTKRVDQNPKPTDDIQFKDVSFGYSQSIDYVSQSTQSNPKTKHYIEINDVNFGNSQNNDYLPQNKELSHSQNEINEAIEVNKFSNAENMSQNSEKPNQLAIITSVIDSSDDHRREEEEEFESEEIISYKVLEEFNKVKSFLKRQNRRMSSDGYSTDSGYRSDSQRSNNRSALQLSGNWLNQSGCCLFNYIMQCHLMASTRDITNEIAQVLSQLIDRLHEEEKYPSFLEDLLETVDLLLRQIYEGDSSDDGEFLKKDEKIQRILLLNKSFHIQKHCLEKITNILEHFHTNVTEIDSTFELSNIDQIENITYIFHILEILLKKYMKNRQILSQVSTQNSQNDEKALKKSSISDIWRKKWNPSQKVFEGSREKKCVLKNCSEILNKIVVDCVSNYSLIAYSALKCFNSMQN